MRRTSARQVGAAVVAVAAFAAIGATGAGATTEPPAEGSDTTTAAADDCQRSDR